MVVIIGKTQSLIKEYQERESTMNSVDGESTTLLDTTADCLTSTIFGPVDDSDDVDV